ncbi:hypothetical protein LPJ56_000820 [Coemansia sp. RSA 2599]|nr:hypothetical protein LPJ75_000442 [Coemansia sp. RSA 2598]KAJ1828860.1 hypothetical protein LPJ56_000820 [Coemansia sp. RSA 2599]
MDRSRIRNAFHNGMRGGAMPAESYEMANDGDEAINGPVVFSCSKCRTILGDTFAYAASLPEHNLFGLEAVPDSIATGKDRRTSELGIYHELSCNECQAVVGRRYLTTAKEMDGMRDLYALDLGKVLTYELGKCLRGDESMVQQPPPAEFYTSVALHEDLSMVKSNVTAIAARLQKLEQMLVRNSNTSPRTASGTSRKRQSTGTAELNYVDSSKRFGR